MNVLEVVSGYLPDHKAGVPKHIEFLIRKLNEEGIHFCLAAQDVVPGTRDGVKYFRMRGYPLEFIKRIRRWKFDWFDRTLRSCGAGICKEEKIDLIHGHTWPYGGRQALHLGRRCGIPVVLTLHGTVLDSYSAEQPPEFFDELKECSRIVVQKPSALHKLVSWGIPSDRLMLQMGPAVRSRFARIRTPEDVQDLKILFACRFDPIKNPALLPVLAKELKARGLPVRITAAGDGPLLDAVKKEAVRLDVADRLLFPGWIDNVKELHADHSVYLALSEVHSVSDLSLLDAMSDGLVPIAVNSQDIDYLIQNGKNGFVCAPSAAAIADAVEHVITHRDAFAEMSGEASATALRLAGENIFVRNHVRLFQEALL